MQDLIQGEVGSGYGAVADEFRRNFDDRNELGAALTVVRDGEVVVDLWGGHRDKKRTMPWQRDTLVTVWSTTKGMAATAMAVAHGRGLFYLETPVANYWPEFAQGGKEEVTVRQLLEHEAGLPVIDIALDIDTIADADRFGVILAAQVPKWAPGSAHGYHAQSLGWYESQLLRRIDPDGRTIGQFFADEVAARMMNPRSMTFKAFTNPKAITRLPDINTRRLLEVELPSVNGTGTARSLAEVYGELAAGGTRLGVSAATLAELERPKAAALDKIFGIESAFRFGFMKPFPILDFGSSPRAYGHTGSGGSFAYADPDTGTGYAYVMNRAGYSLPTDPRETALRQAVTSSIG